MTRPTQGTSDLRTWLLAAAASWLGACDRVDVLGVVAEAGTTEQGPPDTGETSEPASTAPVRCELASSLFERALCTCGSVAMQGNLSSSDALGRAGASIGIGGALQASRLSGPIASDLFVAGGAASVISSAEAVIAGDLEVRGDLAVAGTLRVGRDARLGGTLSGDGTIAVTGDLQRPSAYADAHDALVEYGGDRAIVDRPAISPCACDQPGILAIRSTVAKAATQLGASAFPPAALTAVPAGARLALPPGRVFVDEVFAQGDLTFEVPSRTTLFIGGRLRVDGALRAELGSDAQIELWVAGGYAVRGPIALAPPERAHAARVFVAGPQQGPRAPSAPPGREVAESMPLPEPATDAVRTPDDTWVVNLYAPQVDLWLVSDVDYHGALFVRSLSSFGDLRLVADPAVHAARSDCP